MKLNQALINKVNQLESVEAERLSQSGKSFATEFDIFSNTNNLGATDAPFDEQDMRGTTKLDAITGTVSFALVFGCSPSTGVISQTRFMYDISNALFFGCMVNMTCIFPDVFESLKGTDNNFEIVTSSTLKPLRMFYEHNLVRILRGYIFVQESVEGLGDWEGTELCDPNFDGLRIGEPLKALILGQKVRENLQDTEATNIPEVDLFINKTKAEIIQIFLDIRKLSEKVRREKECSLGVFIVCIGFMLDEQSDDQLE